MCKILVMAKRDTSKIKQLNGKESWVFDGKKNLLVDTDMPW